MKVTRIEVFGFKSFMDRTILPLEAGITGVVGPNGCGKSNIVDALRWVLGETRARSLRGGVLEDVIFNGTDKLRPLGLAEVTITLRSSEKDFFADLISPTLEAEMVAKGEKLQSEDVQEEQVQEDDQIKPEEPAINPDGRPHLTVIEGNRDREPEEPSADTILESEAEDSSEISEDQTEQELHQEKAPQSLSLLTRFAWLKSVNEVQVTRRLYRSGESEFFINRVPCRLKDVKEFFRAVGIGARAYTIVAQGEVSRIVTAKPDERRMILEEAAGVLGFRDKIAAAERRLKDTEINISRVEDIIKEVTRQVNSLKRQASRAKNRADLKARISEIEERLFAERLRQITIDVGQEESKLEEAKEREAGIEANLQRLQAQEQEARSELMSIDVEGDSARSKIDNIKEEIGNRERQLSQKRSRINELKAFIVARESEISRLNTQRQELNERLQYSRVEVESLQGKEQDLISELRSLGLDPNLQTDDTVNLYQNLRKSIDDNEVKLQEKRDLLISLQNRKESLQEELAAFEPLRQLKKLTADESNLPVQQHDLQMLTNVMQIPVEYKPALEAVMRERGHFFTTDKYEEVVSWYNSRIDYAVDSSSPFGVFRKVNYEESNVSNLPFRSFASLISASPGFETTITAVFKNIYLVDDYAQASSYFSNEGADRDITLVTPFGEIITADSYSHGSGRSDLQALRTELEETEQELSRVNQEYQSLIQERDQYRADLEEQDQNRERMLSESKVLQDKTGTLGELRGKISSLSHSIESFESDQNRVELSLNEAHSKIGEFSTELSSVEQEIEAVRPDEEIELKAALSQLEREYEELDRKRQTGRQTLSSSVDAVEEVRSELDDVRATVVKAELELQKISLEKSSLHERIVEDYGEVTFEQIFSKSQSVAALEQEIKSELQEELSRLKKRIQREGEVDSSSIERYEEEQSRLDDLTAQQHDLKEARRTLHDTIERLTETSQARFLKTFDAVKDNFSTLMPRLFGGGKGSIELSDPSNPLESGIDIIARPPGKKLKSIDLLSGGEKALCATGLIFAMFLERPSPLCVLDEVDAPLDDANLVRFISIVKEMSEKTQFLLITHNKASMSAADNLIGVTMQEPGATSIITVSLQEAYEHVA